MSAGTIAVIGLGAMGGPLVAHLRERGETVLVSDLDESLVAAAVALGAEEVQFADVRSRADWALLSLPGPVEAETVVEQLLASSDEESRLAGIVDLTSSDPSVSRDLAGRALAAGTRYVDAGVLGNPPLARTGSLILLIGAQADEVAELDALLAAISRLQFPLGERGAGHAAKLAANELFTAQVAAMAEALTVLDATGADTAVFLEALSATGGRGVGLADIGSTMVGEPPATGFALRLAAKDVRLLHSLAGGLERELPVLAGLEQLFREASVDRPGEDYTRVYQHLAGSAAVGS